MLWTGFCYIPVGLSLIIPPRMTLTFWVWRWQVCASVLVYGIWGFNLGCCPYLTSSINLTSFPRPQVFHKRETTCTMKIMDFEFRPWSSFFFSRLVALAVQMLAFNGWLCHTLNSSTQQAQYRLLLDFFLTNICGLNVSPKFVFWRFDSIQQCWEVGCSSCDEFKTSLSSWINYCYCLGSEFYTREFGLYLCCLFMFLPCCLLSWDNTQRRLLSYAGIFNIHFLS